MARILRGLKNPFKQTFEKAAKRQSDYRARMKGELNMTEEERIKAMAESAYSARKVSEARENLIFLLNEYKKANEDTKAKEAENWLTIFDGEIRRLEIIDRKAQADKEMVKDCELLSRELEADFKIIESALESINTNISNLKPGDEGYKKAYREIGTILNKQYTLSSGRSVRITAAIAHLNSIKDRYKAFTNVEIKVPYVKTSLVEDTIHFLAARKNILISENTNPRFLQSIDYIVNGLKFVVEDHTLIDRLISKYNYPLNTASKDIKSQYENEVKQKFVDIEKIYEEYLTDISNGVENLNRYNASINTVENILSKYPSLDPTSHKNFIELQKKEMYHRLEGKYGKELIAFSNRYNAKLSQKIKALLASRIYPSNYFERFLSDTIILIGEMEKEGAKAGVSIKFDEENYTLKITYQNSQFKSFDQQIVSDEMLRKIKASRSKKSDKETQYDNCLQEQLSNINAYQEAYKACFEKLITPAYCEIDKAKYPLLEEKDFAEINDKFNSELTSRLNEKYGSTNVEQLFRLIKEMEEIRSIIRSLTSKDGQELIDEYNRLTDRIKNIKTNQNLDIISNLIVEKTGYIAIAYKNYMLPTFAEQLIPQDIISKVENAKKQQSGNPNPEQDEHQKQYDQALNEMNSRINEIAQMLTNFVKTLNRKSYQQEIDQFCSSFEKKYQLLTGVDFRNIIDTIGIEQKLAEITQAKYNLPLDDLIELADIVDDIRTESEALRGKSGEELLNEYTILSQKAKNIKDGKNIIKEVKFNEQTGILEIEYNNPNMPKFSEQIISTEVLTNIESAKQQAIDPPEQGSKKPSGQQDNPETKPTPEEEQDIANYLGLLTEINDKIKLISDINIRLLSYDQSNISAVLLDEKNAQKLDKEVMELRVKLSSLRVAFSNKYKKYMSSIDKINKAKMKNIEFVGGSLEKFIEYVDDDIKQAELDIINLAAERNNASPEKVEEINQRIKMLLDYIEAKNSFVNRRIVEECRVSEIDIVAILEQRRESKKEWRKKLQEIKDNKVVPNEPPHQESHEQGQTHQEQSHQEPPQDEKAQIPVELFEAKVSPNKHLVFNPRNDVQLVNREKDFIIRGSKVTISLLKSGIKIKYSQQLKEQLNKLNAKLSLVNKNNYRSRTSQKINETDEEQVVMFKDNRDIISNDEYKNYKVEIRIPSESGKDTKVLYEYDFDPENSGPKKM